MNSNSNATLKLLKFELSPKLLCRIPTEERAFFLTVAHFTNELNVLRKLVLISDNSRGQHEIERVAQSAQSMMLIKLFASKSCAAYEFIKKHRKQPFIRRYAQSPDSGYAASIARLDSYFKSDCLLKSIRNKYVAHYDIEEMRQIASNSINRTEFFYLSEEQGNSLYAAAEEFLFAGLQRFARPGEQIGEVIGRLIDDVDNVASLLTDCAQGVMIKVGKQYAEGAWEHRNIQSEEVNFVNSKNVKLPFFVNFKQQLDK